MRTLLITVFFLILVGCQDQVREAQQEGQGEPDGATPVETIFDLTSEGLSAWQVDSGDWVVAGGVSVSPADETLLVHQSGTGVLVNGESGQTVDLHSLEEFGDVEVHIEFLVPKGSNSGVYFQSRYEVQIFDSWGVEEPTFSDCGGIYQRWTEETREGFEGFPPRENASRPPGEWQAFDIVFRAPRFDSSGNKIGDAVFERVVHNGVVVQEAVSVSGPTRAATFEDEKKRAPLMLQGDHGPVAYRNIRVKPLD